MNTLAENNGLIDINQGKGFTISIITHLLIIFVIISVTSNIAPAPKLMVVDFSILASPIKAKNFEQIKKQVTVAALPVVKPLEKIVKTSPQPVQQKQVIQKPTKIIPAIKTKITAFKQNKTPPVMEEQKPEPKPQQELALEPPPAIPHSIPDPEIQEPATILAQNIPTPPKHVEPTHKPIPVFPAPAAGKSKENTNKTTVSKYTKAQFSHIQQGIQNLINYPRTARRMGWEGRVLLEFIVCEDGTVKNITIVESSGFNALDKNAVAAIKKAAPFPIPPIPAKLIIPVVYRLS